MYMQFPPSAIQIPSIRYAIILQPKFKYIQSEACLKFTSFLSIVKIVKFCHLWNSISNDYPIKNHNKTANKPTVFNHDNGYLLMNRTWLLCLGSHIFSSISEHNVFKLLEKHFLIKLKVRLVAISFRSSFWEHHASFPYGIIMDTLRYVNILSQFTVLKSE